MCHTAVSPAIASSTNRAGAVWASATTANPTRMKTHIASERQPNADLSDPCRHVIGRLRVERRPDIRREEARGRRVVEEVEHVAAQLHLPSSRPTEPPLQPHLHQMRIIR